VITELLPYKDEHEPILKCYITFEIDCIFHTFQDSMEQKKEDNHRYPLDYFMLLFPIFTHHRHTQ